MTDVVEGMRLSLPLASKNSSPIQSPFPRLRPPPPKKTFPTHAHRFTVFLSFTVFPLSDTRTTDNGLQTFMVAVGTRKCKEDRNARTLNNAQSSKFLPPLRDAPAVGSRPTLELKDREKMKNKMDDIALRAVRQRIHCP